MTSNRKNRLDYKAAAWLSIALSATLLVSLAYDSKSAWAESPLLLSKGQVVYVPIYSHIYSGDRKQPLYLAATLSVRNTDPDQSIKVLEVNYHDTEGKLLKPYIEAPLILKPLETVRYVVGYSDKAGGSGAKFIVKWSSDQEVNPPIIESIMIGTQNQLGISFTSRGQAIQIK